ncbi:MAG: VTT domain-containing protein [Treponema sp.]|nr:VTT domain-containing protein [Treponema sp.]
MNDESPSLKIKILCVLFILAVTAISLLVFLNRDKLHYIGNYGLIGVFVLCFISNATVFAPAPSLIVVVTAASFINPVLVSLVGAFGATLGELTGFFSGRAGKRIRNKEIGKLGNAIKKFGTPVIFVFALLPLPLFDIIGVASGFLGIKWYKFVTACLPGKFIKMVIYACGFTYFRDMLGSLV